MESAISSFVKCPPRENSGSLSANRFDYQLSWAFCLLLELHEKSEEYLLILDYHDDVVVIDSKINFYQVKTKKTGKWSLNDLLRDSEKENVLSILGKLYSHHVEHGEHVGGIHFISNAQFSMLPVGEKKVKALENFLLDDLCKSELQKVSIAIQSEHKLNYSPLCKFGLVFKTDSLSLKDHSRNAQGRFADFVSDQLELPNCPVTQSFKAIIHELRKRLNYEDQILTESDLIKKKGFSRKDFSSLIEVIKHRSQPNSWAKYQAILIHEGIDIITLNELQFAWDTQRIKLLDPTNILLNNVYTIINKEVSNFLEGLHPTSLINFLQMISDSVSSDIEKLRFPISISTVKAITLLSLDEYTKK